MLSQLQAKLYEYRNKAARRGADRAEEFGRLAKQDQIELLFWMLTSLEQRAHDLDDEMAKKWRDLRPLEGLVTKVENLNRRLGDLEVLVVVDRRQGKADDEQR